MSGIQMLVQYTDQYEDRTKFSSVIKWHLNTGPFCDQTTFNHSNTRLVGYSDPHSTGLFGIQITTGFFI